MLPGYSNTPEGLNLRPANTGDSAFIESLYRTTREDLRQLDADKEIVENLIDMQFDAQTNGYGEQFPNAMHFVVEKLGERIGRVIVDFGSNEVRIVDIAFIPRARGQGYGTAILRMMQQAAAKIMAPLALSVNSFNTEAKNLYLRLGFQVEEYHPPIERMIWYPRLA